MNETMEVYLEVLEGGSWPKNFFSSTTKDRRIKEVLKIAFDRNGITNAEEAFKIVNKDFVEQNKLEIIIKTYGKVPEMLPDCYDYLVWIIYPESKPDFETLVLKVYSDVLEGRRKTFPTGYFTNGADIEKKAIICFKYLCEDILKLNDEQILETFGNSKGIKVLQQYKLKILVDIVYESLSQLLLNTYPDIYQSAKKK